VIERAKIVIAGSRHLTNHGLARHRPSHLIITPM